MKIKIGALVCALALACTGCGNLGAILDGLHLDRKPPEETQRPAPEPTVAPSEVPAPTFTPTPTPAPTPTAPSGIDLSDPQTYHDINIFLSNFSECSMTSYDGSAPMTDEAVSARLDFGIYHNFWNNYDSFEQGDYSLPPYREYVDEFYLRLPKDKAKKSINYFFDGNYGLPQSPDLEDWYGEDEDYYYLRTTGGDFPGGFVLVDQTQFLPGAYGMLSVDFHVYQPDDFYAVDNSRIYDLRPEEVGSYLSNAYRVFPGHAQVTFTQNESGAYSYKLVQYSASLW